MATFSKASFDAVAYAASRPSYPPALYQHVIDYATSSLSLSNSQSKTLLDLGSGPGLSTFEFCSTFNKVIAIDPSKKMINAANDILLQKLNSNQIDQTVCEVEFHQASSEQLQHVVEDASVDLIVAGQAAHWFDADRVYNECGRVLKPGGSFAFWCYGEAFFPQRPKLTALVGPYSHDKLGPYWQQPGRSIAEALLKTFPFPNPNSTFQTNVWDSTSFKRCFFLKQDSIQPVIDNDPSTTKIEIKPLLLTKLWTLKEIKGYLETWSSLHSYKEQHPQEDPVKDMLASLEQAGLNHQEQVEVGWELGFIMGKKIS
ncbi:trans-aconitate methyltransferase 1 [Microbotryomycetes sp. JL221]|nr:trans-aconitate methyltransferase 1 [Microbotryomycetes sp. JL221]